MSNTLLTVDEITLEALNVLHNEMSFITTIDRQHDGKTTLAGRKRGGSLRIRKPAQYTVRSGWTMDVQDTEEEYDTLTVGTCRGVDMSFTDQDMAQDINSFSDTFIKPAVVRLAEEIEKIVLEGCVKDVYNLKGTAGTTPATAQVYLDAGARLTQCAAPRKDGNRHVQINALAEAETVNGLATLFHARTPLEKQFTSAQMGSALGFTFHSNELIPTITCGTRTNSTPLVDGTISTEGETTLHIDGLAAAAATIVEGDVFTVADVYAVNPVTKATLPHLQQFVVTELCTAGSNEVDLEVSPAMYTSASGGKQTISAFPVDGAAITFVGTASTGYPQNLAYHRDAFTFATAKLEMPGDVNFKAQKTFENINIRILRQYDINNAFYPCRLDVFFGYLAQRPEHACRIIG